MIAALILAGALTLPTPPLTLQTPDYTCRVRSSKGNLVRSRARVCRFLRMTGHVAPGEVCRVPNGMLVDHHIPLACGGCDIPSNLSLLTIAEHAAKSRWERQPCSAWWDGTNTLLLQRGRN